MEARDNPYLIVCPCCFRTICYRCTKLQDSIAEGGFDSNRELQQANYVLRKHKRDYDHRSVDVVALDTPLGS